MRVISLKEVNMYIIRGIVKNIDLYLYRRGSWIIVLEYDNFHKVLKGIDFSDSNIRSIVIGIIEVKTYMFQICIFIRCFLKGV